MTNDLIFYSAPINLWNVSRDFSLLRISKFIAIFEIFFLFKDEEKSD